MSERKKEVSTAKHPEDRRMETEAIEAAHKVIDQFFDANREEFVSLVLTYGDEKAERKCAVLREKFWGDFVPVSK